MEFVCYSSPLDLRIKRLDPSWDGAFIKRPTEHRALQSEMGAESGSVQAQRAMAAAGLLDAAINIRTQPEALSGTAPEQSPEKLAPMLLEEAQHPLGAMSLILALLWHSEPDSRQLNAVQKANIRGLEPLVSLRASELTDLPPQWRLLFIESCLPTLKTLSAEQYSQFRQLLLNVIRADGRIELFEWCLFQLLRHYLDPQYMRIKGARPRYKTVAQVKAPLATALGTLAILSSDDADAAFQRGSAALELPLVLPDKQSLDIRSFGQAIDQLASCYPLIKAPILKAMAAVARFDGVVCPRELTLIKAIAAVIDCPIPNSLLADMSQ